MPASGLAERLARLDVAAVVWLNTLARRSGTRAVIGGIADRLAVVEVGLMVALAATGRRRSAARMLLAVGAVYAMSEVLGKLWPRPRPFAARSEIEALASHTPERSFPSRHVASGLAMATIGGAEHARLGAAMTAVAWVLGLSRVAAGLHYPSDVLVGAALGLGVGRLLRT